MLQIIRPEPYPHPSLPDMCAAFSPGLSDGPGALISVLLPCSDVLSLLSPALAIPLGSHFP